MAWPDRHRLLPFLRWLVREPGGRDGAGGVVEAGGTFAVLVAFNLLPNTPRWFWSST